MDRVKALQKKTIAIGLIEVLVGLTCVTCSAIIYVISKSSDPTDRGSSYGVWGGITFILGGISFMGVTKGHSQAGVAVAMTTVTVGMSVVVIVAGGIELRKAFDDSANPQLHEVVVCTLNIIITVAAFVFLVLASKSYRTGLEIYRIFTMQQAEAQGALTDMVDFGQSEPTFDLHDVSIPLPPYTPRETDTALDNPGYAQPPPYTEKIEQLEAQAYKAAPGSNQTPPSTDYQPITGNQTSPVTDCLPITGNHNSQDTDCEPITGNQTSQTADNQPIIGNQTSQTADYQPIAGNQTSAATDCQPIKGNQTPETADLQPITDNQPSHATD